MNNYNYLYAFATKCPKRAHCFRFFAIPIHGIVMFSQFASRNTCLVAKVALNWKRLTILVFMSLQWVIKRWLDEMIRKQTNKLTSRRDEQAITKGRRDRRSLYIYKYRRTAKFCKTNSIPASQQKALFRGSGYTLHVFGCIPFHDVLLVLISELLLHNCHTVSLRTRR